MHSERCSQAICENFRRNFFICPQRLPSDASSVQEMHTYTYAHMYVVSESLKFFSLIFVFACSVRNAFKRPMTANTFAENKT